MQNMFSLNTVGMLSQLTEDPHWWLTVILSLVSCILPVVAQKAYMVFYRPRPSQLMQEYQYKHEKTLGLTNRQSCCFGTKTSGAEPNANLNQVQMVDLAEQDGDGEVAKRNKDYEKRILGISKTAEV